MKKNKITLLLLLLLILIPIPVFAQPIFCVEGCQLNSVTIYQDCVQLETCTPTSIQCCEFSGGYSAGYYDIRYSTSSQGTIWMLNYYYNGNGYIPADCTGSSTPCGDLNKKLNQKSKILE